MKLFSRGFTLIELLVVISVISLLSAVVLSSLNTARAKGADTAVKAAMKQAYNQAEQYRNDVGGYGSGTGGSTNVTDCASGMFNDARVNLIETNIQANAASGATLSCATGSSGQLWAMRISALRHAGTSWCVDNSGNFRAASAVTGGVCQP